MKKMYLLIIPLLAILFLAGCSMGKNDINKAQTSNPVTKTVSSKAGNLKTVVGNEHLKPGETDYLTRNYSSNKLFIKIRVTGETSPVSVYYCGNGDTDSHYGYCDFMGIEPDETAGYFTFGPDEPFTTYYTKGSYFMSESFYIKNISDKTTDVHFEVWSASS